MEWLLIALVVVVVLVFVSSSKRRREEEQRRGVAADELARVMRLTDEDVTEFGEKLQGLDIELAGRELDEGTRQDYQRALDDYEAAKESAAAVTSPDQVTHVSEILEDGRYAVACVRARVAGDPLPHRRPPCFFDPQHGPSVRDVSWRPDGGEHRDVPACALDAERVEQGAEPDSRKVMAGAQRVPYWQAGGAYAPWTAGYFGAGLMPALFLGTMMGMSFGGFDGGLGESSEESQDAGDSGGDGGDGSDGGDGGGSDYSADGGYEGGGFDGGGDFGGGFGGGDFGGGDFGGF